MTSPAAAADEADEAATVREGAPWGEMSPFVHPTPGTAAVAAVATVSFVVMIALPPATWQAAAAEPAPSDEAPDAARRGGTAKDFRRSSKEQEGRPEAGWPTSLSMVSFFYSRALPSFWPLRRKKKHTGLYTISTQSVSKVLAKC